MGGDGGSERGEVRVKKVKKKVEGDVGETKAEKVGLSREEDRKARKGAAMGSSGVGKGASLGVVGSVEPQKSTKEKGSLPGARSGESKKAVKVAKGAPRGPSAASKKLTAPKEDYLAGLDLPSSDSDEDMRLREERGSESDEGEVPGGAGKSEEEVAKEAAAERRRAENTQRKAAEKLRRKEEMQKAQSEAARADALKEDPFAIDVAFEGNSADLGESAEAQRDIIVRNITLRVKGRVLLDKTDLTIAHGRRYCLVGPNGKGKSTLMRLVGHRKLPVPNGIDVLLVEQEMDGDDRSAIQAVVEADEKLMALRAEERNLMALSQSEQDDQAFRMTEVYDQLKELGSEVAESRAAKILAGLGFTPAMQGRPTKSFSGGWRMRISLARALFIQPTLLLLDEPTNHLDLRAVLWLEEYLMKWKKTLVVVSHDRDFLDSVATDVIHLFSERLHYYRGNFEQFQEMYEQRRSVAQKAWERYEKDLRKAGTSKEKQDKVRASVKQQMQHKQPKKKKSAMKDGMAAVEDIEDRKDEPVRWSDYVVRFHFPEPTELPAPLLQIIDGEFQYPGREDFALKNLNVGVDMGTRVAIVGPNGAGKSTLMNLLAGDLLLTSGDFRRSHKLRIGRYSQHFVDVLAMDVSPVQYLLERFPESEMTQHDMRGLLGRFGLSGENHLKPIVKLSGGQKARTVFASIYLSEPHILLFDEPTNHLDMESIDALADALSEFDGGVVLVSHDSRVISRMMDDDELRTEIWVVDDGTVTKYPGSFEDFREDLIREIQEEQEDL
uniref:Probable ATP-dependent transporter ycf16 n=1 Tax=Compsopogon caeruleus TaxID=31354 RepID=A0A6T6CA71_9RHOD